MADEQIIVDIKVEDKEVNQAEKSIDRLTDSIEELGNRIKTARNQNKEFKKEQQALNEEYKQGRITTEQYEKGIDGLNTKIKTNNKIIADSSVELSKEKRERTANIKLIKSEVDSRDRLRQKIAILNREYNELNKETEEGKKKSIQLQKELKDLNEELNEGSLAAGNFKDNIGNYPEATDKASGGILDLSGSLKALLANPVVAIMAAIVAVLTLLFSAFKKSESGAKLLDKASAALSGVMMVITSIMGAVADAITSAFEDPKQAVIDLWEAIKTNIVNRFEGIILLFNSVGAALKALWNGDLKKLEEAANNAGTALIQIGTGLDAEQQKAIADSLEDIATKAAVLAKRMIDLASAQRAMRAQSRTLEKDIAVLSAEFERLSEIAGDDTRNLHEMRQAAIDAGDAAVNLAQKQIELAAKRIGIINQEVAIRRLAGEDIQDLLDQQAQAEIALTEARSQAAIAQQKILIEQRKIERDIFEQNLDILIDIGDKIKTEQEKAIQNESLSLEKRKQLLEASKVALAANFGEIKKEYELYGVTAEQINEVINASDAKQTNEKLKNLGLNEIANNRLREIILERRQAELDFNDLSKDLSDEEINRKQTANEKIKEINDEATVNSIEDAVERNDKLIELEKEKLEKLLENENLLIEEKAALQAESDAIISELEEEKLKAQQENDEENIERIAENFDEIVSITEAFAGAEAAVFGRISQGIATAFEDGKISATNALQGIGIVSNALFDAMAARRTEDLVGIEAARARELELAGDNKDAQLLINEKFDKKAAVLKLKQFKADKAKALIEVAIATALGAAKALPNLILAGIVTGFGIAQGVIIASKKPPKFAKGTNNIVDIGDSHASGNDVDVFGFSGGQKQYFGKVEKGEAMPVIRKSAANSLLINQLNGKYSSRGRTFADGTNDITNNEGQNPNNQAFNSDVVAAIQGIKIVAKIEDITKQAGKKIEIVDNSKV